MSNYVKLKKCLSLSALFVFEGKAGMGRTDGRTSEMRNAAY